MDLSHHHDWDRDGFGHNSGRPVSQWQTPHQSGQPRPISGRHEADADLIEDAFVEGFSRANDPTSFLRLAGVPLVGETEDGRRLQLLRVEIGQQTDVGSLSPHLGGGSHRYDPLPATMVSKRKTVTFVFFDGEKTASLAFCQARGLKEVTRAG